MIYNKRAINMTSSKNTEKQKAILKELAKYNKTARKFLKNLCI